MKSKFVSKKFLNNYTMQTSNGIESIRFYNDEYCLKFLKKDYLTNDRKEIIYKLCELNHENAVTPEFLLHDKTGLLGYAMINYRDYTFIGDEVENKLFKIDLEAFNKRKQLMIKLSKLFDYFNINDFAYYDIHDRNILYKDNDIKLIDLDGGIFKGYKNHELDFESAKRFSSQKLALYTLSFIYNVNQYNFSKYLGSPIGFNNRQIMIDSLPKNLKEFFTYALSNKYNIFDNTTNCLEELDENIYLESIKILKKY